MRSTGRARSASRRARRSRRRATTPVGRLGVLAALHALGGAHDASLHAPEDQGVERRDDVPVGVAGEPVREEDRALPVDRAVLGGGDPQLEPREARRLHLRAQAQQPLARGQRGLVGVETRDPLVDALLDTPPVQGVADLERVGVPAAPAQPDTADEPVHHPAGPPAQRERVPAALAADAGDDVPHVLGRRGRVALAAVGVDGAARPRGVRRQRVRGRVGRVRPRPARLHLAGADPLQRQGDGPVEVGEPALGRRHELVDVVLGGDDLVDERVDEGHGRRAGHRGHQVDPVRRQARGQHRDRQHRPSRQLRHLGEALHHLQVGQDVGAADVERPVDLGRQRHRLDQVVQDVADGDGLDAVVHPGRREHHGQALGEVAQHLEARRPRPEDHRRLQDDGRDARAQEGLADLGARRQVLESSTPSGCMPPR